MAIAHYTGRVENNESGKSLADVVIRVYSNPGNVLQSVFSDRSATPKPLVETDEMGAFDFYINDGRYDIEYVYNGDVIKRLTDIDIINPVAGGDIDAIIGAPVADGDLGTFTGTTIADDSTVKAALQAVETAVETKTTAATLAASGGAALVGATKAPTVQKAIDVLLGARDATNAAIAAALSNGTIVWLGGFAYRVDSTATGNASATNDLSVDGLVPHGQVCVQHYGGAPGTDCRDAVVYATLNNGRCHFPASSTAYVIASTIDYGALNVSLSLTTDNVVLTGDGKDLSNISYTGTGTMLIGGAASASGSYPQSLSMRGLYISGDGVAGASDTITIGKFTTTSNAFAGCDSTQQLAYWEFTAPSVIEDCDIRFFKTGIQTKFGYSWTIRNNRFRNVNNALNLGGATTTGIVQGNLIELCGIGIALATCSGIVILGNAIQANYGGVDIYSYNWNTLIDIRDNYFELSTKCFVQDGDSGGEFTSNNFTFTGNKSLEVDIILVAQNFVFRNNRMISFTTAATGVERIIVGDNYIDSDDGLALFTAYAGAGLSKVIVDNTELFYSQVYDPGSMLVNGVDSASVTVTGAKVGDTVRVSFSNNIGGVWLYGTVTAANTVQFYFWNPPWGSTVDLASGTLKIWVKP